MRNSPESALVRIGALAVVVSGVLLLALLIGTQCARAAEYQSAAAESSHVVTGQHRVSLVSAVSSAGGFLLVYDSATVPADGTNAPHDCIPLTQAGTVWFGFHDMTLSPDNYGAGVAAAISSTGCFTKTTSPTGFIFIRYPQ